MLRGDVRFAAVGGDPHHPRSGLIRRFQIVQRADARQQQGGDFRLAHDIRCRFNPGDVAVGAKAIVEAGSLQAIAMGHFDGVDPGLIQRAGDLLHLRQGILVTNSVHTIAQRHVRDIKFFTVHAVAPAALFIAPAICSAVASAAEVIISRLPAYAGR